MASGLGKTYLSAFDARNFEEETGRQARILYLAHQGIILEQAERTYRSVFGDARTYGRFDGIVRDYDVDILFATFQSMYRHLEMFPRGAFDYGVVDEAHHTPARTREEVMDHFVFGFQMGLTATPDRYDGRDVYEYYDNVVAFNLPLEKALAEGLLTPIHYVMYTDRVKPAELRRYLADLGSAGHKRSRLVFEPRPDEEIVRIVNRRAEEECDGGKIIVFCNSLDQMDHFSDLFAGSVTVSCRDTRGQQVAKIDAFAAGRYRVLLARDVLNEGVDVPSADVLVFLRNTESPVVFLQQLGRGLRRFPGKNKMLVLDFTASIDRISYVYSFYSRLRAYLASRDFGQDDAMHATAHTIPEVCRVEFDETALSIVRALLNKKIEAGKIMSLPAIVYIFDDAISIHTLQHLMRLGRLVPDYEWPDERGHIIHLFDHVTVRRFVRLVGSRRLTRGMLSEAEFARRIGKDVKWLRRQERWGYLSPSWVYYSGIGRAEFFYTQRDLDLYLNKDGR